MNIINSKNNIKIKDLIRLRDDSKFRNDRSLFYVEGERILKDTPKELIEQIFIQESRYDEFKYITDNINDEKLFLVKDDIFSKIKDTINSQGIIAIIKYCNLIDFDSTDFNNINKCLILDNINDPGNLGTIIRLAEATNIDLIVMCNNCCSLFNTKVIRSCMSSIFRLKFYISKDSIQDINKFKSYGFKIYSTVLNSNSMNFNSIQYNDKSALIFGNEANGICSDLINISDYNIYIPMCGKIESLNVAMAATAVCYELMRQNNYYEA